MAQFRCTFHCSGNRLNSRVIGLEPLLVQHRHQFYNDGGRHFSKICLEIMFINIMITLELRSEPVMCKRPPSIPVSLGFSVPRAACKGNSCQLCVLIIRRSMTTDLCILMLGNLHVL